MNYQPPYTITPAILNLVAEISELIGRYTILAEQNLTPRLRRENRIRTIQASLAIENNTLTLEQVTAVIDGKRVLGLPREIQEVRNAFAAYEAMDNWHPASEADLLVAHGLLMSMLVDQPGVFRSGGVGIFRGEHLVHMAPPADRVPYLMVDLLDWLKRSEEHPLISSCLFHYELEFIHPFADGNGRMGRLWQTLILRQWKPLLGYLPVETIIRERQNEYDRVLAEADERADAAPFVEFMLQALRDAMREAGDTDQVSDQVSDQVKMLLEAIGNSELSGSELMNALGFSHRPTFRANYLNPAMEGGWLDRTQPGSPRSPTQRYRLSAKARIWLQTRNEE
ncbi:Fic family protein [Methylobacter tundripaludum]|uniref:Filamentation induced by cAMP protein Fic n=1 Tax=Methylobacter tundripaludum (strain ATCC BAA-1195 / DSM 17260 / SV96) TaxID=697282 RepID=G3IZG9_METTV|nr:Fic family protein [Methylobacter tundripaludum]EGW20341.1 filamentation induced by cAMP protein Fic [Methylobacter tundripaludum SV96]